MPGTSFAAAQRAMALIAVLRMTDSMACSSCPRGYSPPRFESTALPLDPIDRASRSAVGPPSGFGLGVGACIMRAAAARAFSRNARRGLSPREETGEVSLARLDGEAL